MTPKHWFTLLLMVLVTFVSTWNLLLLTPLQPFVAADLGVSIGKAAQLTTASAGFAVLTLIAFGLWAARLSMRHLIWGGLLSLTIGSFLLTITASYDALLVIRFFNGAADGLLYPAAWVALGYYLPREKQNTWGIAAILAGTGLASVVGLPLTAWLLNDHEWEFAARVLALAGFGILLLSLALPAIEGRDEGDPGGGFASIIGNPNLVRLLLANIFGAASWFGALAFVGSFVIQTYLPSLNEVALFFLLAGVAFTLAVIVTGGLAVTPGAQKIASVVSSIMVVPLAVVFFSFTSDFTVTVALAVIYAVARAPGVTGLESLLFAGSETTTARVPAIAALDMVTAFGTLGGAAVGGIVLSQSTYQGIGIIFAASAFLSLVFVLMYRPEGRPFAQQSGIGVIRAAD